MHLGIRRIEIQVFPVAAQLLHEQEEEETKHYIKITMRQMMTNPVETNMLLFAVTY